jgi:tetratricopeptide (TPR) repeat protein
MPPPELLDRPAPASVGTLVLETIRADEPASRHYGPRAEIAYERARAARCRAAGDKAGEREASIALARLLADRGRELDTATSLARRALSLGDDPALRSDLAEWLSGLGEPALAAMTLRSLCDPERPVATAQMLVKIAVLLARGNDPAGAADALDEAGGLDPTQPLPLELLGTIATWAPAEVPPAVAAAGYLAAATRHDALGDPEAAFEDRLRAFEIAPDDGPAAKAAAAALAARGTRAAADEVLRAHAVTIAAAAPARAEEAHCARVAAALEQGSPSRALGAVLDGGLEAALDGDAGLLVDRALGQAALHALVAMRQELRFSGGDPAVLSSRTGSSGRQGAAAMVLYAPFTEGKERERADALVELASTTTGETRSVLLAVASEGYAALGAGMMARKAAEEACAADPASARALTVLAKTTSAMPDRSAALTLERNASAMLIRTEICEGLARALELGGDALLSLTWTQRWLALRPGCPRAMRELVRRATRTEDAARLEDALGWVLAQPRPLEDLASPFGDALEKLFELDVPRAVEVARYALELFGPRVPGLRGRVLAIGDQAGDSSLAVGLLERLVSSDAKDDRAVERLFDLAQRRAVAGDWDGAAAELARAAARGAAARTLGEHLDALEDRLRAAGASFGSDGIVSFTEAKVRALDKSGAVVPEELSTAWRQLGSVRWDLAKDPVGAEDAFYRAALLASQGGMERYARDLCEFAGPSAAIDALVRRAQAITDEPRKRAGLLIEASNLAHAHALPKRALETAASAIQIDPARADAVAIVEKCSNVEGGIEVLDGIYDVLAGAALGCYGRRAAHYRAARQLERRGAVRAALRHAVASFEAVPSEGTSYVLMSRLAERAGDPTEPIRAIERVAEAAGPHARATWLKRAAALAGSGQEAARARFDLLLRALAARPDTNTVAEVGTAIRQLLDHADDDGLVSMRFERAATSALRRADGPDGARIALAMARVAFELLGACRLGLGLVDRALAAAGDVDEFQSLQDLAPSIAASDPEAARGFLDGLLSVVTRPYASVGASLLRLGSGIAQSLGDVEIAALLLVQAVRRAPEDDDLVCEADAAVRAWPDASLIQELDDAVAPDERLAALLRTAERKERAGAWGEAIDALERALGSERLSGEGRDSVLSSLRRLFVLADRAAEAEALLVAELERESLPGTTRARVALDLSAMLTARGEDAEALELLGVIMQEAEPQDDMLAAALRLARRTGERPMQAALLDRLLQRTTDDAARLPLLRELAALLEELGEQPAAIAHYRAVVDLDPSDARALEALEKDASERGDHATIADLLARRVASTASPETRRTLRLRRAAVLEQRLGRLEDACAELEALLSESPDDISALRFLADIRERLGAPLRAAPLWQRLGELSAKTDERSEYGLRAASDYLAGGDAAGARIILESIASIAPRDAVIELRAGIARRQGDTRTLSEALDQLATASRGPAEKRAGYLVEAARVSSSIGDEGAALDRIRRAVRLAPQSPAVVLEARRLEYRARGGGTPREAQLAIDELTRIAGELQPEQMELQTFLLAEELDVIQGGGAGMRELNRRHTELGPAPLIALGMAERLVRNKSFDAALPLFERALAGDLRGLRSRGRVALAAADAAINAGLLEAASRMLEAAATEPDTRPLAMRKRLEFVASYGEPDAARAALDDLIRQSAGLDRGRFMLQLGRLVATTDSNEAIRLYADAFPLALPDKNLTAQIAEELANARIPRVAEPEPPRKDDEPEKEEDEDLAEDIPIPLHAARTITPGNRTPAPAPVEGGGPARETSLFEQLMAGSYEAGERLAELYGPSAPERSRDLLVVRKHQAELRPGDRPTLEKLHQAALLDRNPAYARAIEHILSGFDPAARPVSPPSLSVLADAPDLVASLLFRAVDSPVNESLAITWDTGRYRHDAGHYDLTGVERVQPGAATLVGETYGDIARLLGAVRTGLFHKRTPAGQTPMSLAAQVVLLSPPAVVLTGEVREETPELRYVLGAALAGAMPEHVLVGGLSEEQLRTLIEALRAAFGPVGPTSRTDPGVARLGQDLWQIVPPRGDRRLREIFAQPEGVTYEAAVESARRAMRRAGLFAAGDVPTALTSTIAELGLSLDVPLSAPDGLARACAAHPALGDLVRLATRSEYGEARWNASQAPDRRRDGAARRFRGT